jgi:MFS family permease
VFAVLHGLGNGILTIAKGTLPLAYFGPVGYGRRQGWIVAPSRVAQAFAPLLFGALVERWGAQALWVSGALVASACLCLLWLHPLTADHST